MTNSGFSEFLRAAPRDRRDVFLGTSTRLGTPEQNVEKDFWVAWTLDVLFNSFIVIDLKMTPFKPEYAGKMNFYLSAVDDLLRHADDKPSIGLILCKTKNRIIAEYALRNSATPMGVSEFRHLERLPDQLKGTLPTIEEIEAELGSPGSLSDS